jgi:hypothetical protein
MMNPCQTLLEGKYQSERGKGGVKREDDCPKANKITCQCAIYVFNPSPMMQKQIKQGKV